MSKFMKALISIVLIVGAGVIAVALILTAPEAKKKKPPRTAPLVKTLELKATDETVVLELTGTVIPAEAVMLRARVNGEIIKLDSEFIDGGLLSKGDKMLGIDPIDYQLALVTAEAQVETARFNHKMELGRQDVARREWKLLKAEDATPQEEELALRIPHLAASQSALKSAEAKLKKAQLDLDRTQIRAPFNAIVLERNVNVGSQTSPTIALAKLAGTDAYWIKVSVATDRLSWLNIPGGKAEVISSSGAVREGRVIRKLGNLELKGRMARLLIEIKDPLSLLPENADKKTLLIGEFVRTKIEGHKLKDVYMIPRKALRDNRFIWIAKKEKLDIREVDVLWRNTEKLIIKNNLSDGEKLIISDLTTPIQGRDINTGMKRPNAGQKKKFR